MSKFGKLLENWFGWCDHDWPAWEWRNSKVTNSLTGLSHECTVQIRICKKCGHTEVEKIR